jgi:hypothetical protein
MGSYTITITPDDTSRASTTLRVDVSDNASRITELLVRAGADAGLGAHQLPAVDLDLLLRAISAGGSPAAISSTPSPTDGSTDETTPAETATAPDTGTVTSGRRGGGRRTRGAGRSSTAKATTGNGSRTGEKTAKSTRTAAKRATGSGGERAYRRAPSDLIEVFNQLGGVTAVARHYGVPRHTAQSWVRRLRNEGRLPTAE